MDHLKKIQKKIKQKLKSFTIDLPKKRFLTIDDRELNYSNDLDFLTIDTNNHHTLLTIDAPNTKNIIKMNRNLSFSNINSKKKIYINTPNKSIKSNKSNNSNNSNNSI